MNGTIDFEKSKELKKSIDEGKALMAEFEDQSLEGQVHRMGQAIDELLFKYRLLAARVSDLEGRLEKIEEV